MDANEVSVRSNDVENSLTVSSHDIYTAVLMGEIKTYSTVTMGVMMFRGKSKNCSLKAATEPIWDIYVRDVSNDISFEDILEHLTDNGTKMSFLK